jgi:hypothetical protein
MQKIRTDGTAGLWARGNPIASGLGTDNDGQVIQIKCGQVSAYGRHRAARQSGHLDYRSPEIGKVRSPRCRNAGASLAFSHADWSQARWAIEWTLA